MQTPYETKTRGTRILQPVRPCGIHEPPLVIDAAITCCDLSASFVCRVGEGVYSIFEHTTENGTHTSLAYRLEVPLLPKEVLLCPRGASGALLRSTGRGPARVVHQYGWRRG